MPVNCSKCSRPMIGTDVVQSLGGNVAHVDCKRPQALTVEERALLLVYCFSHAVAHCVGCDIRFRLVQLAADSLSGGTNLCPRCRRDLTESVRGHLYGCAMLPTEVRRRAHEVRDAARHLVKQSQQLRDWSEVLIREAEANLFERQRALREAMSRRIAS
jgi:hypothetical protein